MSAWGIGKNYKNVICNKFIKKSKVLREIPFLMNVQLFNLFYQIL